VDAKYKGRSDSVRTGIALTLLQINRHQTEYLKHCPGCDLSGCSVGIVLGRNFNHITVDDPKRKFPNRFA